MQKDKSFYLKPSKIDLFKLKCSQVFLYLCVVFFAISICINVTYSVAPVYGKSMYPTINESFDYTEKTQDYVVLNYIKTCNKGDVIVAKKTFEGDEENYIYVIKRLIATEGDSVEVDSFGNIYINDVLLEENYAHNKQALSTKFNSLKQNIPELFKGNKLIIPKNQVFYLGDNRGNSTDCSNYGPVDKQNIIAKVDYLIKSGENFLISIINQIFKGEKI